ncbi:uncharacterized protein EI97DRAFT_425053 [Westerdykella ornata]|uniref:Altered inheritance of mitochondria protein 6 n=1 Tax=Westerdykella ornata TaxID=318751 RepID=A0A6A6JBY7_WESOR|nr:uncharacterized protein EI97DRAFT_425053 [Westerdykella ornata]KAF2273146.1 hypothetical protein EI97DRAFT_425053 [Westerdykella ornata]
MLHGSLNGIFSFVEVFRCINYLLGLSTSCPTLETWASPNNTTHFGFVPNTTPVQCHSHNDYWHRNPLYDALSAGCVGIEADVWLFQNELFVGHNTNELTLNRTFRSLYVDPLLTLLNQLVVEESDKKLECSLRGLFEGDHCQSLVLLVDYKNHGPSIHPFVKEQLSPLREKSYLTYFNGTEVVRGPITVVATGNAPFDLLTANSTHRDIFFDAPLARLYEDPSENIGQGVVGTTSTSHFDITNSYYASTNFRKAIGTPWRGRFSEKQIQLLRGQVRGAKRRGLKPRYWGVPSWPVGLRNTVWETLIREGVDMLAGDDLMGMATGTWWDSES